MTLAATPKADRTLHAKVNDAIRQSPYLRRRELLCEDDGGAITLRGVVSSYFQKQMAQETIRSLDGVVEIRNELEVVPLRHRAS